MKGKIKRFLLIFSFIFCLFGTGSAESLLNADTVFAGEKDDDYSFYKVADSLSVWFNKELVPDKDNKGVIGINDFDAGEAGSLIGYTKENLASWITSLVAADSVQYSYNSLKMTHVVPDKKNPNEGDRTGAFSPIYQYAVYGWVLRETGADAYVNSFFMHPIHWITGGFLVVPYLLVSLIPLLFSKIIDFLQMINPFGLIGRSEYFQKFLGSTISVNSSEYGVGQGFYTNSLTAQFARWYNTLTNVGLYIAIPGFIVAAVAMYFVFKKTQGDKSHFKKIILRIASILITVPLMGMFYTSILNDLGDKFEVSNPGNTVLSKTVVDFGQWAKQTRLAFPEGNGGQFRLVVKTKGDKLELSGAAFESDYENAKDSNKDQLSLPEFAYSINSALGNSGNYTDDGTNRSYSSDVVTDAMFSYADIDQTTGKITVHNNTSNSSSTDNTSFSWLPTLMGYWSADTINANDFETEYKAILSSYVSTLGELNTGDGDDLKKTLTDMTKHFNADGSEKNMNENNTKNVYKSYSTQEIIGNEKDGSQLLKAWSPAYLTAAAQNTGIKAASSAMSASSGDLIVYVLGSDSKGKINSLHDAYETIVKNQGGGANVSEETYITYLTAGGLTPVSMYNYLASEFKPDSVTIYSTRDASSGMVKRPHTSVNIIGRNGFEKFVYGFGACISMIALAVLGFFYGFAILFSSIKNGIQLIVQTPFVLLGSITAAFRVASLTIMMILEVVVTIVMYEVASELVINVYNVLTGVENHTANVFLVLLGAIGVCVITALLVKYRRVAVKAIEGVIDSVMQKIANLFGSSYQGTGSAAGSQSGVGAGIAGLAGAAAGTALAGRMAGHGSGQGSSGKNGDTITGKAKGGSDDSGGPPNPPGGGSGGGDGPPPPPPPDGGGVLPSPNDNGSGGGVDRHVPTSENSLPGVIGGDDTINGSDINGQVAGNGNAGGGVEPSNGEATVGGEDTNGSEDVNGEVNGGSDTNSPDGRTGTSNSGTQNKPDEKSDSKDKHDGSATGLGVWGDKNKGGTQPDGKAGTSKGSTNAKPTATPKDGKTNDKTGSKEIGDKKETQSNSKKSKPNTPNGSVDTNRGNGAGDKRKGILGGIFGRVGRNKNGENINPEGKKKNSKGTTNGTNATGVKTREGMPPKKINPTAPRTGTNTNGKGVSSKQGSTTKPATPKTNKKKNPISSAVGKMNTTMGKGIKAYGKALGVEAAATMLDRATGGHGGSAIRFSYLNGLQNRNIQGQNTGNTNTNEVKGGNNMSAQDNISSRLGYRPQESGQINTNRQNIQDVSVKDTTRRVSNNVSVNRNVDTSKQQFVFNPDTGGIQRETHIPPSDTGANNIGEDRVFPKIAPKNNKDK